MTPQDDRPWLTPQVGDRCRTPVGRGRMRTVTNVTEFPPAMDGTRRFGTVVYRDHNGIPHPCWITTWVDWCSRAVRDGGSYRRKENDQ